MRVLFLACTVTLVGLGVCSVGQPLSPEAFLSQFKTSTDSRRETKENCSDLSLSHLKWAGIKLVNYSTNDTARSYYENFNTTISSGDGISNFQLAIEYDSPEIVHAGDRKWMVNWYNLLFTSSLFVRAKSQICQSYPKSYLGFVELIKTDTTLYKNSTSGIELKEWNLAKDDNLQYVMTKPSQDANHILADDKAIQLNPVNYGRIAQLKYEGYENLTIDFKQYPLTSEYEKLVEKKIFLVQTSQSGQVLEVIAGVDVMMYLHYQMYNPIHLNLKKKHSLVQWIIDSEKYIGVLNDKRNQKLRDRNLLWKEIFQNPSTVTLNPLLDGQRIFNTAK